MENNTSSVHTFEAEAMNTVFAFRLRHSDREQAQRIAGNGFRLLESLEDELSRFRADSEVTRINQMKAGDSMLLADATYRCLMLAMEATNMTAGLFDVTIGSKTWSQGSVQANGTPLCGKLALSPDRPFLECLEAGRQIDLGGIGKGFALDEIGKHFQELGVESALLSAGASTHLVVGQQAWEMELRGDEDQIKLQLKGQALSSSGIGIQGAHIIDPDTGDSPSYAFKRLWVVCDSAAIADAYSTACMLMREEEIPSFAKACEGEVTLYTEGYFDKVMRKA
ncbi:FAD:protein FMN transferase [Rubellicoccus peritrichatus]|uniref:FAD:protein FMN transferase n=1 Tax=Rubellicoccus peritrichatus TaxID=3080537 RepID=A0AAQ3LDN2_9BACT|nr:FAD:protein FMN transferase [Puniceicoccus sp. CR14]WOO40189.1 FAD:protein FMN transferase [Puniceicoccus sp. CR14]